MNRSLRIQSSCMVRKRDCKVFIEAPVGFRRKKRQPLVSPTTSKPCRMRLCMDTCRYTWWSECVDASDLVGVGHFLFLVPTMPGPAFPASLSSVHGREFWTRLCVCGKTSNVHRDTQRDEDLRNRLGGQYCRCILQAQSKPPSLSLSTGLVEIDTHCFLSHTLPRNHCGEYTTRTDASAFTEIGIPVARPIDI